ncbi:LysE family translocator [Paenibacillus segetis]|uniref:Lysine transporter LysE n=1 Tax=Paenibacillus segetis TaxID=1325360 RepID=A0ABQ1YEK1_9BACL|nr:LysE family transporter [Paenibacillus segetis]GGH22466.1 lysine transporter LysE [Paenibacillus segetis]
MEPYIILKGLILGFSIAAPIGPIGVMCIRTTLSSGRHIGIAAGFGAATADACYGLIAGLGLTALSSFLLHYGDLIHFCGGIFLCYLGLLTFLREPAHVIETSEHAILGSFASTFLLTLTNPVTIISFAGIFAATGLTASNGNGIQIIGLVSGVFIGSAVWWILLSIGVSLFRSVILTSASLRLVNRLSAVILFGFGMWTLIH